VRASFRWGSAVDPSGLRVDHLQRTSRGDDCIMEGFNSVLLTSSGLPLQVQARSLQQIDKWADVRVYQVVVVAECVWECLCVCMCECVWGEWGERCVCV
jgi:hypothetical protein